MVIISKIWMKMSMRMNMKMIVEIPDTNNNTNAIK